MKRAYTVAQITSYIRNMFSQDFVLHSVCVTGEISNCKYHQTGHVYFTLKDEKSSIACVIWSSDARKLTFRLEDGMSIEAEGSIDIYEKGGSYQLYVRHVKKCGEGELFERYLRLKEELEERGMFSEEYKRPIPKYINRLGVVTAPVGAAVRDIIQISHRRNPWVQIILYPALVQGEGAAASIVRGIHALEKQNVDTIIVGRGGGSIEDLWAFNEEAVAQAIFDCEIPVISAVGHETDFTIADFVADKRASTPSAGAEMAVYEAERILGDMNSYYGQLMSEMSDAIKKNRIRAGQYRLRLDALSPSGQILQKKNTSAALEERLENAMRLIMDERRHRLQLLASAMNGLSPLEKLGQGYSVACSEDGRRLHSVHEFKTGDRFRLYMSDGFITAEAEDIHEQ